MLKGSVPEARSQLPQSFKSFICKFLVIWICDLLHSFLHEETRKNVG